MIKISSFISNLYSEMPKSKLCKNPYKQWLVFRHVRILNIRALKFPINMSENQMFGLRQFGLKPNNFWPNCPKSEQLMSEIQTFCPMCPNTSSAFRRCSNTEPSENGTEVNVRISGVDYIYTENTILILSVFISDPNCVLKKLTHHSQVLTDHCLPLCWSARGRTWWCSRPRLCSGRSAWWSPCPGWTACKSKQCWWQFPGWKMISHDKKSQIDGYN